MLYKIYLFFKLIKFKLRFKQRLYYIYSRFNDTKKTLVYIHVGKCGGASLKPTIYKSQIVQNSFKKIFYFHVQKPPILKRASYAVIIRDPIQRTISAFNWRYKRVVLDKCYDPLNEKKILLKYKSINALAEKLYVDGALNEKVEKELMNITHIRENIAFYLQDVLNNVKLRKFFAIFFQESLNDDISYFLNIQNNFEKNKNTEIRNNKLSKTAIHNLKMFLRNEYELYETLKRYKTLL